MNYTLLSLVGIAVAASLDTFVLQTFLLRRRAFWTTYAIVLGFQLLVNGALTGLRIVRYDPRRIVGWRVAYAPIEDVLFGFAMITITLSTWVWLGRRAARRAPAGARPVPRSPVGPARP